MEALLALRLHRWLLAGGLLLWLVSLWNQDRLPAPGGLRPELLQEPVQAAVQQAPFVSVVGGVTYQVKPLYRYELHGLVVSRHDSDTWWDYIHKAWNDKLNVADLCVVWGNNIRRDAYRALQFSSGQFVCYVQADTHEAFERFDPAALSNNHLLSPTPALAARIRSARLGDQVRFSGYLAEYAQGQNFKRGTSTVRTDTGNGACETVWVDEFEVLQRGGGPWRLLDKLALVLIGLGLVAWYRAPILARN